MFSSQNSQVSSAANYIEECFSTYLYTGNGSTQTITNGIDLSTYGGMTWIKGRNIAYSHAVFDTVRGATNRLVTNATDANSVETGTLTAFNSTGFSIGSTGAVNNASGTFASWTFRKQPKFFDVVTYTGSNSNQTISHNLGSAPGCIIIKNTTGVAGWAVYHRSLTNPNQYRLFLNTTAAEDNYGGNFIFNVTSTSFDVAGGSGFINSSGSSFVAYVFAHNAGGFGLTGTDNVISCGSYTANGNNEINLGYEPQWILEKRVSSSGDDWEIADVMRNMSQTGFNPLMPNTSSAEAAYSGSYRYPTATGYVNKYWGSGTIIYIAIRRGPMKVPTSGTSVFTPVSATPSGATTVTTNFPVDLAINAQRDAGTSGNKVFWDRLRGSSTAAGQGLFSNLTNAEVSYSGNGIGLQSNTTIVDNYWNTLNGATTPVIYWNFRRAPSFFDEVCYTGTGSARTLSHNLQAVPELMIFKRRSAISNWDVYCPLTSTLQTATLLNSTDAGDTQSYASSGIFTGQPTSSGISLAGNSLNNSGTTYVAYLFATCPGVSKVGSYTGNGSTQTIDCGFTGGARFVLLKATSTTGNWMVYDTARGMTTLTDPFLSLNSTSAETATLGACTTVSTGFAVNESILAGVNTNGVSFVYLAIA